MKKKLVNCFNLAILAAILVMATHAQTFSVLHAFTGAGDGVNPYAGVTFRGGALFGTTYYSTARAGNGSVFELQPAGSNWLFSSLYLFNGPDGANPESRIVFGPDSHLYGNTMRGGQYGAGTVFELIPPMNICKTAYCPWHRTLITDHFGQNPAGSLPSAGDMVWDDQGNIYGPLVDGFSGTGGALYELTPGSPWTSTLIYWDFRLHPVDGPTFGYNGHLFGTLCCDDLNNSHGSIYELQNINGTWTGNTIYTFTGGNDGTNPEGGLVADSAGNLYGTTADGGTGLGGAVFELSPSGNSWTFQVIYAFTGSLSTPCGPTRSLTLDAAGNLYGTTLCNGFYYSGNVFKLTHTQNGWVYSTLYDFKGVEDGFHPYSQVAIGPDGTLYGTTSQGGDRACDEGYGCGVVWMIKP